MQVSPGSEPWENSQRKPSTHGPRPQAEPLQCDVNIFCMDSTEGENNIVDLVFIY